MAETPQLRIAVTTLNHDTISIGLLHTSSHSAVTAVLEAGPDHGWYLRLTSFGTQPSGRATARHRIVVPAAQIHDLVALLMAAAEALATRSAAR